jgi:hypothetical protein
MTETCEMRVLGTNRVCGHEAKFTVRVGTRQSDAQHSCGQHLARTCMVMAYGDADLGGRPKDVTVITLAPL